MTGEERRKKIIQALNQTLHPISASNFAKQYGVSRQVIVGDVALIRASGMDIYATARGYLLKGKEEGGQYIGKIVSNHLPEPAETEKELQIIVENGGTVLDVQIEHAIYGEIKGNLDIRDKKDIQTFIHNVTVNDVRLLSALTSGIHIHTIRCENEEVFQLIKERLLEENLLYTDDE